MTHTSTEQERADFEAGFIAEKLRLIGEHPLTSQRGESVIRSFFMNRAANGDYISLETYFAWWAWQAARRAPVVPVWYVPVTASISTVQRAREDGWNKCVDAMLAAAPQPPDAFQTADGLMSGNLTTKPEAAPVQMPEPVGVLRVFEPHEGAGVACTEATINATNLSHGWHTLYTEQQVRQLLSAHGIKVIE